MLTPDDIRARQFLVSLRGYDREEVQAFLAQVAEQVHELESRLEELRQAGEAQAAEASAAASEEDAPGEQAPTESAVFAEIGMQTQRILEAAQEAGTQIRRKAKQDADHQLQEARQQAAKLIAESERRRDKIEGVVGGLEEARGSLAEDLRQVGRTVEQVLRRLTPETDSVSSVREALSAEARREASGQAETRHETPPADAADDGAAAATQETAAGRPEQQRLDAEEQVPREPPHLSGRSPGPTDHREGDSGEWVRVIAPSPSTQATEPRPEEEHGDGSAQAGDQPGRDGAYDAAAVEIDDPLTVRSSVLGPLHRRLVRRIKRGLADLQNVALDRLRRSADKADVDDLALTDDELAGLGPLVAEALQQAYDAGAGTAGALAGRRMPAVTADRDLTDDFIADGGERVRSSLTATLRMGLSAKESRDVLHDRVGAVFTELKQATAEQLAATHLVRAYELGLLEAWRAGGVTHRRWVLGKEPRCPEARCRHNDQAGALAVSDGFPSGHDVPPVHVGCTCTTVPISES